MRICVHVTSFLASEALKDFLTCNGHDGFIPSDAMEPSPDIILVDVNTVDSELTSRYPGAMIVLLDTGFKKDQILALIAAERVRAVVPQDAGPAAVLDILETLAARDGRRAYSVAHQTVSPRGN